MKFEMKLDHRETDEDEINACENRLNFRFPSVYKEFLLNQNGGMPVNCLFEYDETKSSCVGYFFGINLDPRDMDLENNVDAYQGRIPEGFLPIGEDPGGNVICIGGDNQESVFFWFHEAETDPPTMNNMYLVATKFKEFLDSLEPDEGEDW